MTGITHRVKLQIILALAFLVALLSGYTALHRMAQTRWEQEPADLTEPASEQMSENTGPAAAPEKTEAKHQEAMPPALDLSQTEPEKDARALLPRNILFTYVQHRATSVYLSGDFNGWKLHRMDKEGRGIWRARLSIIPGAYKYQFVMAGKKYRDPYNPKRSGDSSVLIVDPLATSLANEPNKESK